MTQKMTVWRRLSRPQGNRTRSHLLFLCFSLFWCELLCLESSHRGGTPNYRAAAQRATKQQNKTALFCGENNGGLGGLCDQKIAGVSVCGTCAACAAAGPWPDIWVTVRRKQLLPQLLAKVTPPPVMETPDVSSRYWSNSSVFCLFCSARPSESSVVALGVLLNA